MNIKFTFCAADQLRFIATAIGWTNTCSWLLITHYGMLFASHFFCSNSHLLHSILWIIQNLFNGSSASLLSSPVENSFELLIRGTYVTETVNLNLVCWLRYTNHSQLTGDCRYLKKYKLWPVNGINSFCNRHSTLKENWELHLNQSVVCRATTLFTKSAKVWNRGFYSVADLRGAPGTRPPSRRKFLHFHAVFGKN